MSTLVVGGTGMAGLARARAKGVKLGRRNKRDGERSADEERWRMSRAELEKRIPRVAY
jgi:hypothetical protein